MGNSNVWHEARSSSWLGGTYTAWCGITVRKRDVQTRWFGWGSNCPACRTARRAAKRGRR